MLIVVWLCGIIVGGNIVIDMERRGEDTMFGTVTCTVDKVYPVGSAVSVRSMPPLHRISTTFVVDMNKLMTVDSAVWCHEVGVMVQLDDNSHTVPVTRYGVVPQHEVATLFKSILTLVDLSPPSTGDDDEHTMNASTTSTTSNQGIWGPMRLTAGMFIPPRTPITVVSSNTLNQQHGPA